MKIRNGFVSNSSSCSFTCDACGFTEAGHDYSSPEEYGLIDLVCEHRICEKHLLTISDEEYKKKVIEILIDDIEYNHKHNLDHNHKRNENLEKLKNNISRIEIEKILEKLYYKKYIKEQCPVCSLAMINDEITLSYLLKSIDKKSIHDEIRNKFASFNELRIYLKQK
jgi:hypothetical protein